MGTHRTTYWCIDSHTPKNAMGVSAPHVCLGVIVKTLFQLTIITKFKLIHFFNAGTSTSLQEEAAATMSWPIKLCINICNIMNHLISY